MLAALFSAVLMAVVTLAGAAPPVRVISWEQWVRESCTIGGKLEPECVVELARAEQATDPDVQAAYRFHANEIMSRARDAYEQEQCIKRRMPLGTVRLGMTAFDVHHCGWGRPLRKSFTESARGAMSYWVYSDGRSLTFRDLKVVSITYE